MSRNAGCSTAFSWPTSSAYDVYKDSPAPLIVNAAQIPVNDPMLLVPAMAA
ncbi:MAG: hypothetical protein U1E70_14115 [Acetobacteraceae bacterium]